MMHYLASPYSHWNPLVRWYRWILVNLAVARLMKAGVMVFSPIVHCHMAAVLFGLPKGFAFWASYDHDMIERCDAMVVLTLPGWEKSAGVRKETEVAQWLGRQVSYVKPGATKLTTRP